MKPIDLEIWEPNPEDPRYLRYVGQPVAEDVFRELENRLKESGFLPDEYFLMSMDWENGKKIPKGAEIFCTADYGGSEGVYVDVYLKWYEKDKSIIRNFATGKTLGETGYDMDRMFLVGSAITKAFHGETRRSGPSGTVLCLSVEEKNALAEMLSSQEPRPELKNVMEKLGVSVQQEQTQTAPPTSQPMAGMEMSL